MAVKSFDPYYTKISINFKDGFVRKADLPDSPFGLDGWVSYWAEDRLMMRKLDDVLDMWFEEIQEEDEDAE